MLKIDGFKYMRKHKVGETLDMGSASVSLSVSLSLALARLMESIFLEINRTLFFESSCPSIVYTGTNLGREEPLDIQ